MNVDVLVNGRQWKVAVEPAAQGGQVTVTLKGKSRVVDASWIDADTLSLFDRGVAREIRLHPRGDGGAVGVEFGARLYEAVASAGDAKRGREGFSLPSAGKNPPDPFSIKAPMPGRVVRVLVAAGDHVKAHQPVVIVEAMKMENELRTPRDGIVTEVLAIPGATVEAGAILIVVDQ